MNVAKRLLENKLVLDLLNFFPDRVELVDSNILFYIGDFELENKFKNKILEFYFVINFSKDNLLAFRTKYNITEFAKYYIHPYVKSRNRDDCFPQTVCLGSSKSYELWHNTKAFFNLFLKNYINRVSTIDVAKPFNDLLEEESRNFFENDAEYQQLLMVITSFFFNLERFVVQEHADTNPYFRTVDFKKSASGVTKNIKAFYRVFKEELEKNSNFSREFLNNLILTTNLSKDQFRSLFTVKTFNFDNVQLNVFGKLVTVEGSYKVSLQDFLLSPEQFFDLRKEFNHQTYVRLNNWNYYKTNINPW